MDSEALSAAAFPWYRLRSTQYDQIYLSPHMDDAVYSCGGQIALERDAGKQILIITVFGSGEDGPEATARVRGVFSDYAQRKREERAAAECLDVDHLWLNLPDLLERPKRLGTLLRYGIGLRELPADDLQARIYALLAALLERLLAAGAEVYAPLAVGGHPDHRVVHAVARALARQRGERFRFYEDIPYAQVRALRDERLRYLGLARSDSVLRAAREVQRFAFAQAPAWQQPLAWVFLTGHALFNRALLRLAGPAPAVVQERDLEERVIDEVIQRKVAAMRAYVTQTAFFYPAGAALYERLVRAGDHYVERYWRLELAGSDEVIEPGPYAAQASERVEALLRELSAPR